MNEEIDNIDFNLPKTDHQNIEKNTANGSNKPSSAYVLITWVVLIVTTVSYLIGLYNAEMQLNEKGYYLTILLFGLFSVIALQKSVRDKIVGIPVTNIFYTISWVSAFAAIALLIIGLWNADLLLSEKGFFGIAYMMSLYSAISVQKNIRDLES